MTVRVGINGFGRIGRSFYRALLDRGDTAGVELVAVNDPFGDSSTMAFLLKHDSVAGTLKHEVKATDDGFSVDGHEVKKLEVREPAALVDAMVEKLLRDLIAEPHPVITAAMPSPPSGAWAE